jgi:hypothetical protein
MAQRRPVASTGFWIFDESVVALETPTASIEVTRPQELELYVRMFDLLATAATTDGASGRELSGSLEPRSRPKVGRCVQ